MLNGCSFDRYAGFGLDDMLLRSNSENEASLDDSIHVLSSCSRVYASDRGFDCDNKKKVNFAEAAFCHRLESRDTHEAQVHKYGLVILG